MYAPATFPSCPFLSQERLIFANCTNREVRGREPLSGAIDFVGANSGLITVSHNPPGVSRRRIGTRCRLVIAAVERRLHRWLLASKHDGTLHLRKLNHSPFAVVAKSTGEAVLGIQGDHRNFAKLTPVIHVVLRMDGLAEVRENLHEQGLKCGRLLPGAQ